VTGGRVGFLARGGLSYRVGVMRRISGSEEMTVATTATAKRQPNWPAIRGAYEANRLSTRAIARQNGISHTAIQKRAAAEGWARLSAGGLPHGGANPAGSPRSPTIATRCGNGPNSRSRSAPAPITIADRGRDLALRLLDELDATTAHLGEIEQAIVDETAGDTDGRRRQAMLRAVDLQRRAMILKDIATASRTLADGEPGKKEQAVAAAGKAASGRYATPATPPKLVVDNGGKR
jgi:hypothetical protein